MPISRIDISWQTIWRVFIFAAGIFVLYYAHGALSVFLVAVVVSLGLDPLIGFLEEKKINRLLGTIFVFLSIFVDTEGTVVV